MIIIIYTDLFFLYFVLRSLFFMHAAVQRIRQRWYFDPKASTGAKMFESCERKMLKWLKEQKKLDPDFFLEISDEAKDISELAGFTPENCKEWERELEVHSYGQLEDLPEMFSESELDEEDDDY